AAGRALRAPGEWSACWLASICGVSVLVELTASILEDPQCAPGQIDGDGIADVEPVVAVQIVGLPHHQVKAALGIDLVAGADPGIGSGSDAPRYAGQRRRPLRLQANLLRPDGQVDHLADGHVEEPVDR